MHQKKKSEMHACLGRKNKASFNHITVTTYLLYLTSAMTGDG